MMTFNEQDLSIENTPDHKLLEQIANLKYEKFQHGLSSVGQEKLDALLAEAEKRGLDA